VIEPAQQTRLDRVALVGAVVALAGATLLPFVELRPNRLVPGVLHGLTVAGPWALAVWVFVALGFAAAVVPGAKAPRAASTASAVGMVAALAWALGTAARTLLASQPAAARVSMGTGVWALLVGAAILGFASRGQTRGALWRVVSALVLAGALAGERDAVEAADGQCAREFAVRATAFWGLLGGHIALAGAGVGLGVALGVPLGLLAARNRRARVVILGVTGVIQTVPSLALLGLLIVPLSALGTAIPALRALGVHGIGATPGLIALTLYALLPVARNTCVGLTGVDPAVIDAGLGMGMSRRQLLMRVELPLALPLIVNGVRTAAVLLIGITTLTAFAGARNLGVLVIEGLGQFAPDLILLGALPIIILAVAADGALSAVAKAVTPEGVRA
jgi:osmoprotectant transport system permease protein